MTVTKKNETCLALSGRIDSSNAAAAEQEIASLLDGYAGAALTIDADALEYISSAGLRVLLRLRKRYADLEIVNVRSEVYEIFEMTGFTEMMRIAKAYRRISVEGCEVIGRGANGEVYRRAVCASCSASPADGSPRRRNGICSPGWKWAFPTR